MSSHLRSAAKVCRTAQVLLGALVTWIGLYTHVMSNSRYYLFMGSKLQLYEICYYYDLAHNAKFESLEYLKNGFKIVFYMKSPRCPKLKMDLYFVQVVIVCFFLSLCNLKQFILNDFGYRRFFIAVGFVYHSFTSLLLLTAALLYGMYAEQIKKIDMSVESYSSTTSEPIDRMDLYMLYEEKMAAVALTIMWATSHVASAVLPFFYRGNGRYVHV